MIAEEKGSIFFEKFAIPGDHAQSDYFSLIKELVRAKSRCADNPAAEARWQESIDEAYELIVDEIRNNRSLPVKPVSFGTSGWRGMIGKDLFVQSVSQVTLAIVEMYKNAASEPLLSDALGVKDFAETCRRGCVIGFDNRFGGWILAEAAKDVLTSQGIRVYFAGESTTGVLSAAVLERQAAFSINLTPSHNPLEYGGFKFNAADAGPAAAIVTSRITENTRKIMADSRVPADPPKSELAQPFDALDTWISLVRKGEKLHGLNYDAIMDTFRTDTEMVVAVDCVHGASRVHIDKLFKNMTADRLIKLRNTIDYTFGGIAPEPSSTNMQKVIADLNKRPERLKLGVIIDPDADRIRFTDGTVELDMNQFGAMAYHYLHEIKGKKGMVAKNVATSNLANRLAESFGEEIYEARVGFKEFKPVIGRALVFYEESDGISLIGHTPEKDAYIGLLLAMDMMQSLNKNLGLYLSEVETRYGAYFPARDGVTVSQQGPELLSTLAKLEKYRPGEEIKIGGTKKKITKVIDIDGRKMIFEDGGWIMIRPSGTEPKVRFYVEARDEQSKELLFAAARDMLAEIGLI